MLTAPLSGAPFGPVFNSRIGSDIVVTVVLMYSNVPLTVKLPEIIALPPMFKFLLIPTPPVTINAPEPVVVDSVPPVTAAAVVDNIPVLAL